MNESIDAAHNLNQALLNAMDAFEERPCLLVRHGKRYRKITYRQFRTLTLRLAGYLHELGITHGERVAIIADNSLEWMMTFVSTLLAGGVTVPLRDSVRGDTLRFILQDTGARLVVLQKEEHIEAVVAALDTDAADRLFDLHSALVVGTPLTPSSGFTSLNAVLSASHRLQADVEPTIREHAASMTAHDLASILYVPSDTGQQKGAVFEHGQMLARAHAIDQIFPFDSNDLVFTFKTWGEAHSLAPALHCFLSGIPIVALEENYDTLLDSLQQASPTVMFATPHSLELFFKSCMSWLAQQPESNQQVFQWALTKGREYWAAGSEASPALKQAYRRADLTFFNQLRGQMGGRLRYLYSTGASLPNRLTEFYEAIGIPVINMYSLAETGGLPAAGLPDAPRNQSVGRATPGHEIRIADDGEIMVRGEALMRTYWRRPEETQQAFDEEGWLGSGDLGYLDEAGYLYVTGRKEYSIVLSIGHKITPAPIEKALIDIPFVAEAAVFGDDQPYLTALILPDLKALNTYLGLEIPLEDINHPRIRELVDEAVQQTTERFDQWEQVQRYTLLDPKIREQGSLSGNSRGILARRFAPQIAAMYPAAQTLQMEEVSQVQVDPERMRALLEKESVLDAWIEDAGIEFIFDLARLKQIDAPSMIHICDAAATIAQIESEEKPLSTAFIVGDPVRIAGVLPESQIQLLYHDHIRRMRNMLVTLAQMVDGTILAYVLDKYGYVRGIHRLSVTLPPSGSMLLGPHSRRHAAISAECNAIVFYVPYGGRQVRVFANGELVGRYANGDWYPDNLSELDRMVADLADRRQYDHKLVRRILRAAFQMSEVNKGAIFMLGDADRILQLSDAAEISSFATILSADINEITDEELINFAKQDGATVIDNNGTFRGCMVLLRPLAKTRADIGPGKGARHSSAAKTSREAECLAIAVSQDGPITIYDHGKRILSL